jgi:DNA-binding transcriptional MerR regulator
MNPPSFFPGTRVPFSQEGLFQGIFAVTNGITLSQICDITGLEPAAVQNWIKRGYVNPPVNRKYAKGQVARIILIHMLREALPIERVAKLLSYVNGNLLDRSDDIMDDSDIYDCLCRVLTEADQKPGHGKFDISIDLSDYFNKIDKQLEDFKEPYPGAGERLKLALKAMVCAYQAARFKRYASQLTEGI